MLEKIQNKRRFTILAFIYGVLLFSSAAQAFSDSQTERVISFIQRMGNEATSYINDTSLSNEQEKNKLKDILNHNFDMYTISRFALGTHWKKLTAEQQREYRSLFEDMIVSIYARKLSRYQGRAFQVTDAKPEGATDYIVSSYIIPKAGDNISVNWRIRFKNDEYKIVDVSINDVSMIITQRADFSSIIQRNGGKAAVILDYLRDRAGEKS